MDVERSFDNPLPCRKAQQEEWRGWKSLLARSITSIPKLEAHFALRFQEIASVLARYPMRINPYYLSLIKKVGDPIYRQCVPDPKEIADTRGLEDPLDEGRLSPVPGLIHRYPDRVVFLVSNQCAVYCRFCNRKRMVGRPDVVTRETIQGGLEYIKKTCSVRDVLLSGGDPLLLDTRFLQCILKELRSIRHVEIIRIGTRVPCTLPQRITSDLVNTLKCFHPLYINTHFNHPREITSEAARACGMLADAGIPLGNQTVLLEGVNDDTRTMVELVQRLLQIRVRPYYLFQADLVKGTAHFWTPIQKGLQIMAAIQGHTSGMCLPHFAVDLPGGGGKVPLLPDYVLETRPDHIKVKNYMGRVFSYPTDPGKTQSAP